MGLDVDPPEGWDSWDDYNSYVQSIMPTQQTESGWNWFYDGPSISSEALAPTISYDRATMMGLNVRGGEVLNLLTFSNGTQLITQNGGLAPLDQRTTVTALNSGLSEAAALVRTAAATGAIAPGSPGSGSGGASGQTNRAYTIEISIALEVGASQAVADNQVQVMQGMLDLYSAAGHAATVGVRATNVSSPVAHPASGQWVQDSKESNAAVQRLSGSTGQPTFIFASSPVVDAKGGTLGGFAGSHINGGIISTTTSIM